MKKFFIRIYRFFEAKPAALWIILAVIVGLSVLSASRLHLVEDIGSFLPGNRQHKNINEAYQHLGGDNKLVISIAMADTAAEAAKKLFAVSRTAKKSNNDSDRLTKYLSRFGVKFKDIK